MTLTKTDLHQIRGAVREEVGDIIDQRLESGLKPIKKDLRYIKKTVEVLIERSDREETLLKRRVAKIEQHLNLHSEN